MLNLVKYRWTYANPAETLEKAKFWKLESGELHWHNPKTNKVEVFNPSHEDAGEGPHEEVTKPSNSIKAINPGKLPEQNQRDINDALDHLMTLNELDEAPSIDEFDVLFDPDMPLNDMLQNDDIGSWGSFRRGELANLDDSELSDELSSYRSGGYAERILDYKNTGKWPPIIVMHEDCHEVFDNCQSVGDGRGRVNAAYGMGMDRLPAIILKPKKR